VRRFNKEGDYVYHPRSVQEQVYGPFADRGSKAARPRYFVTHRNTPRPLLSTWPSCDCPP